MPVGFPDYYGGLTLPVNVAEGGTGRTSITDKVLLYGAGTSHLIETNVGTANQILQIDGTTLDPTFKDLVVNVSVITGILPIAHGGNGTSAPVLEAGTAIQLVGSWPNYTINNTSLYGTLADPLPVAHGGTDQTTLDPFKVTKLTLNATTGNDVLLFTGHGTASVGFNSYGNVVGNSAAAVGDNWNVTDKNATAVLRVFTDGTQAIEITGKISNYNGQATAGGGVPSIVKAEDATGVDPSNPPAFSYNPPANGFYRATGYLVVTAAGSTGTASESIAYNDETGSNGIVEFSNLDLTTVGAHQPFSATFWATTVGPITFELGVSNPTGSPKLAVHYRLEAL